MANKQISDLQARTFDGDSIIPHDVENTDPSTMSQKPYLTGSATGHAVADFIGNGEEYTTDLDTVDKHINGAINELHAINGYSYDAYDDTATYSVGDLCIYNNTLYKALQATTGNLPTNTTYWEQTSIADEIGRIDTALIDKANTSDITTINALLNGYSFKAYTLEGNGSLLTLPSYTDTCIIFIARGGTGLYVGHWTGITTLINDSNFQINYYSNPSRINVINNSPTTSKVTVIRK